MYARLAVSALALVSAVQDVAPPERLLVRGGTLLPMTGTPGGAEGTGAEPALADHALLVEDGRIAWIGPASEAPADGAEVLDATGLWVLPGLIDSHVHLFDPSQLDLWLANGVTTVFNLSGTPFVVEWRERIRRGELVGPAIFTTGPQVKDEALPAFDTEATLPEGDEIEPFVRWHRELGFDFVKVWSSIRPPQYEALLAECRRQGVRVTGHVPSRINLRGVVASGQDSIAHVEEVLNKFYVRDLDPGGLAGLRPVAEEEDFTVISTLITYEMIADTLDDERVAARMARPENRYVDPALLALWGSEQNDWWKLRNVSRPEGYYEDALEFMLSITRVLHEAGIPILAGSDAGLVLANLLPGFSLHRELEILARAGLSNEDVLRSATVLPGEFLEPGSGRGTLAVGAPADLLLLRADPRASLAATREIEGVVLRGLHHDRAALDARLARVEASKASARDFYARVEAEGIEATSRALLEGDLLIEPPSESSLLVAAYHRAAAEEVVEALRFAELACRLYPDSYANHLFLGGLSVLAQRPDEAREAWTRALELRPDHLLVRRRM